MIPALHQTGFEPTKLCVLFKKCIPTLYTFRHDNTAYVTLLHTYAPSIAIASKTCDSLLCFRQYIMKAT